MNLKKENIIDITALILTYNEELHIERCILSIKKFAKEIIVIDSFSTDRTSQICSKYNVRVIKNKFKYQAQQMNWALENIDIKTEWIIRVDADEYFSNNFEEKLNKKIWHLDKNISGIIINRKVKFLNKIINYGSTSPHKTLRIWKKGKGYTEDLLMDEQIIVKGETDYLDADLIDENLKSFNWWIRKHKRYAEREAINYLSQKKNNKVEIYTPEDSSKINKYSKLQIYYNLPIFIRPFLLFVYCYIIKLGFLSGWQGSIFYAVQVFWYRLLVDFKIWNMKKNK